MIELGVTDCWRILRLMEDAKIAGLDSPAELYLKLSLHYRKLHENEDAAYAKAVLED